VLPRFVHPPGTRCRFARADDRIRRARRNWQLRHFGAAPEHARLRRRLNSARQRLHRAAVPPALDDDIISDADYDNFSRKTDRFRATAALRWRGL